MSFTMVTNTQNQLLKFMVGVRRTKGELNLDKHELLEMGKNLEIM